jgi:hypothetical protein
MPSSSSKPRGTVGATPPSTTWPRSRRRWWNPSFNRWASPP